MSLQDFGTPCRSTMTEHRPERDRLLGPSSAKPSDSPSIGCFRGAVRDRIKAYANGWYTVERTPDEFTRNQARRGARLPRP